MTNLLQFVLPMEPKVILGLIVAAILLALGIYKIVKDHRRNARLRNEVRRKRRNVAHLQATAAFHAKNHELDGRGY